MIKKTVFFCLLLMISWPVMGLRCGNQLIAMGDQQAHVLALCGPPLRRHRLEAPRQKRASAKRFRATEVWVYSQGPTGFLYRVRFWHHRVAAIKMGRMRIK